MKIIIDECLPKRVVRFFPDDEAWTVPQIGLSGANDSELLDSLDARNIDVFVTIDGNIEYQQQFVHRRFGTVIIRSASNRYEDLQRLETMMIDAVQHVQAGEILHVPV